MMLKIFAVYDSQLGAFFTPFFMAHEALAKRAFRAIANDPASQICQHPQDFTLFELGEWNDATGEFGMYPKHVNHGLAGGYKVKGNGHGSESSQPLGDEAHVQRGAQGGDPAQHV